MTSPDTVLVEQRRLLSREMLMQRQSLAQQLRRDASQDPGYPRSMTMRLLLRHPVFLARLAIGVLRFLRKAP